MRGNPSIGEIVGMPFLIGSGFYRSRARELVYDSRTFLYNESVRSGNLSSGSRGRTIQWRNK